MYTRCPGQDMRNLRVSLHKCPGCGAEVEIFARQCLGEERWRELRGED